MSNKTHNNSKRVRHINKQVVFRGHTHWLIATVNTKKAALKFANAWRKASRIVHFQRLHPTGIAVYVRPKPSGIQISGVMGGSTYLGDNTGNLLPIQPGHSDSVRQGAREFRIK